MATELVNYQCPKCTAPLQYSTENDQLECEYCGSSYHIKQIEWHYEQQSAEAAKAKKSDEEQAMHENLWGKGADRMRAYSCPSCGAELICDHTTAATSCPYCGNPTIVPAQFAGVLRPRHIIPFKVSKEEAVGILHNFFKRKPLLPRAFTAEHHIEEIKGVYVPTWLFDANGYADVTYAATRSETVLSGNVEHITTHHYLARRGGHVQFDNVPMDGSTKMADEYMYSIEPFDYSGLVPFSMAYLPGFLADRYDVGKKEAFEFAKVRMENSAKMAMQHYVRGYDTAVPVKSEVNVEPSETRYALLPVWLLHTKYRGKDYMFAINGQTGKLAGNLPISWGKLLAMFAGITLAGAAIYTAIMPFFLYLSFLA